MFRSPYRWILINNYINDIETTLMQNMSDINIFLDSEVLVIHQNKSGFYKLYYSKYDSVFSFIIYIRSKYLLRFVSVFIAIICFSVYKISSESKWQTELYGIWNITNGLKKSNQLEVTALRRLNLDNYELKICYVLTDNDSINHLADEV